MFVAVKTVLKLTALFLVIIASLPSLLCRTILSNVVFYFFSVKMVEARSSFFLAEDFYSQNSYSSMIVVKLGGRLDVSELKRLVQERLINQPKYPELKSKVVYWVGYLFWKKDQNFTVDRHVFDLRETSIPPPNLSNYNQGVDELAKNIMRYRTWKKDRPLWEIMVANKNMDSNPDEDVLGNTTSFLVIKYHHSLCDGYAAYNVFGNLFGEAELGKTAISTMINKGQENNSQIKTDEVGILKTLAGIMTKAPIDIWNYFYAQEKAKKTIPVLDANSNDFRVISVTGPLEILRNAKRKHGVDFNSMYIAGITAFYRKLLQIGGQVFNEDANIGVTLLMPGHSDTLSNHAILLNIVLPLGEPDSYKRLAMISHQMKTLTRSHVPMFVFLIFTWLGSLPHKFLKFFRRRRILTANPFVATNLGGLEFGDDLAIGNCAMTGAVISMNYPFDGPGFKIGLITHKGNITISTSVKTEFLPDERICEHDMEQVLGECFKEWGSL